MSNLLFFHDKVIDQSGFANVYGNGYKNRAGESFNRSDGVKVNHIHIINFSKRLFFNFGGDCGFNDRGTGFSRIHKCFSGF